MLESKINDKYAAIARELLEHLWVSPFGVVHADTENNRLVTRALERAALEGAIEEAMEIRSEIRKLNFDWRYIDAYLDARIIAHQRRLAELDAEAK